MFITSAASAVGKCVRFEHRASDPIFRTRIEHRLTKTADSRPRTDDCQNETASNIMAKSAASRTTVGSGVFQMPRLLSGLTWVGVAIAGATAFAFIALSRGETISAAWLVVAAICTYLVAYRFYSRFIAYTVFGLNPHRATPAERLNNGRDFMPTNK